MVFIFPISKGIYTGGRRETENYCGSWTQFELE